MSNINPPRCAALNRVIALFNQAVFRASLPHPFADGDYALYDVGVGCEVAELVPGVDLLSDSFRVYERSLAAALDWNNKELARAGYNLFVSALVE